MLFKHNICIEPIAKLQTLEKTMILSQFAGALQKPELHRRGHT
jgi:hypothetical protein